MAEETYCKNCGSRVDPEARFCTECGTPVLSQPPYITESEPVRPSVSAPAPPATAAHVPPVSARRADEKFCSNCGAKILALAEICPKCGVRQIRPIRAAKDRVTAGILAILLGSFGAHKFYLEKIGLGILYLCFFWTAIPGIIGLIEGIIYLTKTDEEFEALYVQ